MVTGHFLIYVSFHFVFIFISVPRLEATVLSSSTPPLPPNLMQQIGSSSYFVCFIALMYTYDATNKSSRLVISYLILCWLVTINRIRLSSAILTCTVSQDYRASVCFTSNGNFNFFRRKNIDQSNSERKMASSKFKITSF